MSERVYIPRELIDCWLRKLTFVDEMVIPELSRKTIAQWFLSPPRYSHILMDISGDLQLTTNMHQPFIEDEGGMVIETRKKKVNDFTDLLEKSISLSSMTLRMEDIRDRTEMFHKAIEEEAKAIKNIREEFELIQMDEITLPSKQFSKESYDEEDYLSYRGTKGRAKKCEMK